jgi:hypothetical protein
MLFVFVHHIMKGFGLKGNFPKLTYSLLYAEMTIAIVIGLLLLLLLPLHDMIAGAALLLYAAFIWICARNYGRRRALEKKVSWEPSRFDRAVAICLNSGVVIGVGFLLCFVDRSLGTIGVGAAAIVIAFHNLFTLYSGRWTDFP